MIVLLLTAAVLVCMVFFAACGTPTETVPPGSEQTEPVIPDGTTNAGNETDPGNQNPDQTDPDGDSDIPANPDYGGDTDTTEPTNPDDDFGDNADDPPAIPAEKYLFMPKAEYAGKGDVDGYGIYSAGETVTVTAREYIGYEFAGWYDGATLVSTDKNYTFDMPGRNVTYTARFDSASGFENFYYNSTADTCTITGYIDDPGSELIIPEGVTHIGNNAFFGISGLEKIVVANSVRYIGASAFYTDNSHCDISELHIGDHLKYIGYRGFAIGSIDRTYFTGDITKLLGLEIPHYDYIYTLFGGEFYVNGELLTDLVVPEGTTRINDYIFYGYDLNSLTLPASIEYIGALVFGSVETVCYEGEIADWCNIERPSYDGLSWNSGNVYIGGKRIEGELVIPDGVTSIGNNAFAGFRAIDSVVLPDSLQNIGSRAFYGTGLKSVVIPASVGTVGEDAFYVYVGNNVIDAIDTIYFEGTIADWCTLDGNNLRCNNLYIEGNEVAGDVVIPEGVTNIRNYAFYNCSGITGITFPESVTFVGDYAFNNCINLEGAVLPERLTSIGFMAFGGCGSLRSITIPSGTEYIDPSAFSGCYALEEINYNAIALDNMSGSAIFGDVGQYSDGITVNFGAEVKEIPAYMFACDRVTAINFAADSVCESVGERAFSGCSFVESIILPETLQSIGHYAFERCRGLTEIVIPESVTSMGESVFSGCYDLTIYCEAASRPADWNELWNTDVLSVVWDCNNI